MWAALVAPSALQWLVTDCAFSVEVPDCPEGVIARRCWFRRQFSGGLGGGVFETTLSVPPHRLTYVERGKAECSGRYDFQLLDRGDDTLVLIERSAATPGAQGLSQRVIDRFMARMAEQLPQAVRSKVDPGPNDPRPLLTGVRSWHRHKSVETEINAPGDVVWAFVDGDAVRAVDSPSLVHRWQVHEGEDELQFAVVRTSEDVLIPSVHQVLRPGRHHTRLRGAGVEQEHELLSRPNGVMLRTTVRWNRLRTLDPAAVRRQLRESQLRVKAAAEMADPSPTS